MAGRNRQAVAYRINRGKQYHCCGGNSNFCALYNNNNGEDPMPIYLDEAILHRIAFTVWHTALHLEHQHTYADSAPMKNPLKAKQQATLTTQPRATKSPGRFGARTGRMDLSYVTERIIALWVPGDVSPTAFRQGQQKAAHMLQTKHGNNYMVFNLSEPRRVIRRLHERVRELGWPADLAPPLERLCSVCKDIESWLSGDVHRIAVIHASGSKDRIGVVIAAYMHYSSICGSADQALDRFAMGRYLDDKVGDLEQPSHKRYVEYFSGLLSGSIRINSAPLYLTHVTVLGAPAFEPAADDGSGGGSGGCRAFLKVYEGLIPVYTSGVYTVCGGTRQFTVNVAGERSRRGLQLRGDILLKCYHRHYNIVPPHPPSSPGQSTTPTPAPSPDRPQRELIFACQFHTCAVTDYTLSFTRQELDFACQDLRFPLDGAVELHFSATPEIRLPSPAPTPAVPVDTSDDPVTRWDSYENVLLDADTDSEDLAGEGEEAGVSHTLGPLDGSLYATISKKQELQQQTATSASPQQQQQQQPQQPVGSPHTVSMDSGISSAGNGLLVHNKQQNVSPPPNGQQQQHLPSPSTSTATPLSPEDHHRALDELLNDMLLTVENIPDLPPPSTSPYGSHSFCRHDLEQPPHYHHVSKPVRAQQLNGYGAPDTAPDDVDPDSIPYHARQDSRPFTYGAIPTSPRQQQGNMLQMHPGLASPSLVRKASFKSGGVSTNSTLRHHSPSRSGHPEDLVDGDMSSPSPRDYHRYNHNSPQSPRSPEFHDGHIVSMNTATTTTTSSSNLTWLQRQQQKLRERKEVQLRTERYPTENRLMSELRFIQQHPYSTRLSASHRVDGYTSDTTHFADDDDDDEEEDRVQGDFTVPLHINTTASPTHKLNSTSSAPASPMLPNRTSSRHYQSSSTSYISSTTSPLGRQKSDTSFDRERPFVAVKRAHEQNRKLTQSSPSSPAPPLGLVLTHHNGHDNKDTTTVPDSSGLLTLVQESAQQLQLEVGRGTDSTECVSSSSSVTVRETTSIGSSSNNTINGNNNYTGQSQEPEQQQLLPPPPPPPPLPLQQQQQQEQQPDALASLIATLAATSAPASASSNTNSTACQQQLRDESFSSWQTTSISGDETGSPPRSSSPRPQTPAFPVHPRTPYVNSSSQQFESSTTSVTASSTGLPPKSPTTQRRMSNSGSIKNLRKWPSNSSISSKDRSPSPVSDVPTSVNIVPQQNISITSTSSGGSSSGRGISTIATSNVSHPSDISYLQQSPKSSALQNGSTGQSSPTVYYGHSRRSSIHSNSEPPQEVSPAHIKFVRDTSKYWYKPTISREEAINMLRDQPPGTFVVRDSNSFPGAFGLALKVATPPPNVQGKSGGDPANELIRHFLIEPTSRGVKLKGCSNEPVFSSLSALVYQHSLMPMALPCRLLLPDASGSRLPVDNPGTVSTAQLLLAQGAACNVLYLYTMDTESLTGPQAIKKAIQQMFSLRPLPVATVVHFKVSGQGITLTDNKRQLFFRRHYPVTTISYCGLDPDDHRWSQKSEETGMPISSNRVFGFIARKPASKTDNQCHIFAELEPEQPASAIVNFVSKVMMSGAATKANIV